MTAQTTPFDLYYWPTPNGWKITIMLEELGVPYDVHYVNIGAGDQFKPNFLEISPNNKMPALVDPEGPDGKPISIFESGAILLYLARKFRRFLPDDERGRVAVEQWLMWQMGGFGPMLGQNHHFGTYAPEKIDYAINRYRDETHRLYGVLNKALEGKDFVTGNYSIADMAIIGWVVPHERQAIDLAEFPNVKRWFEALKTRPAVATGLALGKEERAKLDLAKDKAAQSILFNQRAR
ncbi:glutathione S-transferase N-terminal domain-containing protein [uncultured Cohaesibacter sp.]|uniref:glutathione S-transferase N-terminal domain-containing protein n=1 Tax=uncultured Cohaesibacter sp. TaxID=1002546 RepID=UPI00292DA350|nr:glutathione S-transferase N-terminal domain-containing protein [uncultured Cohaesibacter sp.]